MVLAILTVALLLVLRLWGAGFIVMHLAEPYATTVLHTLGILLAVAVAVLADRLIRVFYWDAYLRRRRKREIPALIEDIVTVALLIVGLCIGLYFEVGLSGAGIFTASGATAIIIGIALQTVIQDMFSGLSVNFDRSYVIGDWLTIYSSELVDGSAYGCVSGITWRTTFLRLQDGRLLMVPNRLVTSNPVLNHSRPFGPKRLSVEFLVDIRVPADRVMGVVLGETYKAVRQPGLSAVPVPVVLINKLTADAANYEVRFYSNPNEVSPEVAKALVLKEIQKALGQFALPTPVTQIELTQPPELVTKWSDREKHDALARINLFKDVLDGEKLAELASRCKPVQLPPNVYIIQQGEEASSMYVLLEGAARVMVASPTGEVKEVAIVTGGDIVGEMSLMTGAPRSATVITISPVRALDITKDAIGALLKESPQLLERFSVVLAQRQAELNQIAHRESHPAQAQSAILARMSAFFGRFF